MLAAAVLATVGLGVGDSLGGLRRHDQLRLVVVGSPVGFALFGVIAVRGTARQVARLSEPRAGIGTASALHLLCSIFGYILVLLGLLQLLNVNLGALLVGGAVTGVILGIAAQQTLGSFFAGLVLLFTRPYVPEQQVTVHSGALGGQFAGTITDAALLYTTLMTPAGQFDYPTADCSTPQPTRNRPNDQLRPADRCRSLNARPTHLPHRRRRSRRRPRTAGRTRQEVSASPGTDCAQEGELQAGQALDFRRLLPAPVQR